MTADETIVLILKAGYENYVPVKGPIHPAAQFVHGSWHIPRWGCNTLQQVFDVLREQEAAEKGREDERD